MRRGTEKGIWRFGIDTMGRLPSPTAELVSHVSKVVGTMIAVDISDRMTDSQPEAAERLVSF